MDENIFKEINQKIIATYAQEDKWLGHRIFAVDGSKINLPRKLISSNYKLPSKNANYPQGLLSCLYQIKSQMPFDFDLVSHANERICAQHHLHTLEKDDVVVYDRGYFSYVMLHHHFDLNLLGSPQSKQEVVELIDFFEIFSVVKYLYLFFIAITGFIC